MKTITFDGLCDITADNVLKPDVLYELGGDLEWIKLIIYKYNKLKFLTWTSQPGSSGDSKIYKTCYDRKYKLNNNTLNCIRLQRAFIRGYMYRSVSNKLYELLENHEYIFMKTTTHNRTFNGDVEFGSMSFIRDSDGNYIPVYKTDNDGNYNYSDNEELKTFPDANESFRLGVLLHRPIQEFDDSVDEVEIFDTRWNDNSTLWTTILDLLISIENGCV